MGLLDLFGKEPRQSKENIKTSFDEFNFEQGNAGGVVALSPKSFNDVEEIIISLRSKQNVIVKLDQVKQETAIRIIDMLSGAVFALGGGVCEISENTYMFSPNGVKTR